MDEVGVKKVGSIAGEEAMVPKLVPDFILAWIDVVACGPYHTPRS